MLNMPMQQVCFLQVSLDPRSTDSGKRLRISLIQLVFGELPE